MNVCLSLCLGLLLAGMVMAEEPGERMRRLLTEFSRPERNSQSGPILDSVLGLIDEMTSQGRFATADRYVDQLELARIGRTFSLFRSPAKQDQDAQLFRIRTFIAGFYRAWAESEAKRGNTDSARNLREAAGSYTARIEATRTFLRGQPDRSLPLFEDEVSETPFGAGVGRPSFVPIPTTFFCRLSPVLPFPLSAPAPFLCLPTDGPMADVALDPGWAWFLGSWQGWPQSVIVGMSPAGQAVFWVAGPLSGNRSVSYAQSEGRWVIMGGTLVEDDRSGEKFHLFPGTASTPRQK